MNDKNLRGKYDNIIGIVIIAICAIFGAIFYQIIGFAAGIFGGAGICILVSVIEEKIRHRK